MNSRIDLRNIERPARFDKHRKTKIAHLSHEAESIPLEKRFASGEFNQWQSRFARAAIPRSQFLDFADHIRNSHRSTFSECISCIAVGTTEITGGQSNENTGKPSKGAFALQTQVDFVDDKGIGHPARNLQRGRRK
jgi:hypothetical protein